MAKKKGTKQQTLWEKLLEQMAKKLEERKK
ncbi:hypothetical protein JV16_01772 [Anoxybacillus ayderensis]|jgi:hypothetical protein|uniref:Uncharacterized protein n=3 Tax=Anoxybacillus TaxID=150247 RepID=A0A1I0TWC0_9BACL|nr:hypothetical protein JV16_01772 [Anoxybacillus ayderensis]MBB5356060.1 hypothetical protein [Anoxybacillus mongoliensis]SFA55950.1 hypothetical protein SAMN05216169_10505 [Anoxybacillus pushchinoensis]